MERAGGQAILPDRHDVYFVWAVCREDSKRLQGVLQYNTDDLFDTVYARQNSLTGVLRPLIQFSLAYFELGFGKQSTCARRGI
jgi:hypothetical protein